MTAKCANPSCSAEFAYLHQGKVFVLKSSCRNSMFSSRLNFAGQAKGLQYAWLCDGCVSQYEVVLDSECQVKVRSRYRFSGLIAGWAVTIGLYAAAWSGDLFSLYDLSI